MTDVQYIHKKEKANAAPIITDLQLILNKMQSMVATI